MEDTKQEKWERGKTLLLESLHKPDDRLRGCSHNQKCYHELMEKNKVKRYSMHLRIKVL